MDIVKWAHIESDLDQKVLQNFLLLRVSAIYLMVTTADEQWTKFQDQLGKCREGMSYWNKSVKGNAELEAVAGKFGGLFNEYEAAGKKYYEAILKDRKSTVEIASNWQHHHRDDRQIAGSHQGRYELNHDDDQPALRSDFPPRCHSGCYPCHLHHAVHHRPDQQGHRRLDAAAPNRSRRPRARCPPASQSLAQGASEQASSLEETSSALEEMASMTRQNADNANQANGAAKEANAMALEGVNSMKRMADAIERIKNSASETAKIIKTIDEIAFQTNLLALNAAVEAARAGEAGKGFAVVAEEVRNLARRSAEAAKTTADLIEGAQKNAEAGVNVSTEVAKNLSGIQDKAGKVATLIAEIAAASKEQSQGIDQVNTAVSEMDKVVQQNAANAEESASASEELSSQAQELSAMVEDLSAIVGGAGNNGGARNHLKTASRVAAPRQLAAAPATHGPALKNRGHTMAKHQAAMAGHRTETAKPVSRQRSDSAG